MFVFRCSCQFCRHAFSNFTSCNNWNLPSFLQWIKKKRLLYRWCGACLTQKNMYLSPPRYITEGNVQLYKHNASLTTFLIKEIHQKDLLDLLVVGVNDALRLVAWLTAGGGGGMLGGVDWVFTSAGESGIVPTFCTLLPAMRNERGMEGKENRRSLGCRSSM